MKRASIIIAVAVIIAGCAKETPDSADHVVGREFVAGFNETTKTSVDASGRVYWSKDDVISYYSTHDRTIRRHIVSADCHSESFTASVRNNDTYIVAAYGGTISATGNDGMTLSGVVKREQTGRFEDAHVSVCKRYFEDGNILLFKNATSLLKFTLDRDDVRRVTFSADDGTKIHGGGNLYVTFNGDAASYRFGSGEGGSSITVNIQGAGTFYISTLPCTINGFSITCYDVDGNCLGKASSKKTLTLASREIKNLGTIDSRIKQESPGNISSGISVDELISESEKILI